MVFASAISPSLGGRARSPGSTATNESPAWGAPFLWPSQLSERPYTSLLSLRKETLRVLSPFAAEQPRAVGLLRFVRESVARIGFGRKGAAREGVTVRRAAGGSATVLREPSHFRNPKILGPVMWFFLHDVAFSQEQEIPPEQQEWLRLFFTEELPHILPCETWRERTRKIVADMQPVDEHVWANRTSLITWVIMFHNHINFDMEKPVVPVPRVLGHYVAIFERGEPVPISFDPSSDSGSDPKKAFPEVWYPGGIKTPEIIMFRMPKVWGPVGWFLLQSLALAQDDDEPPEQRSHLIHFYTRTLSHVLPCPFCGMHLRGHMAEKKVPLPNSTWTRERLSHWISDLHNVVNREKKEPSPQFPWEEVVERYNSVYMNRQPADVYLGKGPLKTPSSDASARQSFFARFLILVPPIACFLRWH